MKQKIVRYGITFTIYQQACLGHHGGPWWVGYVLWQQLLIKYKILKVYSSQSFGTHCDVVILLIWHQILTDQQTRYTFSYFVPRVRVAGRDIRYKYQKLRLSNLPALQ